MSDHSVSVDRYLGRTAGAWLSDQVLVSVAVRPRSFSPSSLALHPRRSASGSCRSTNVPDVAVPHWYSLIHVSRSACN
jgi:hypothetical protein